MWVIRYIKQRGAWKFKTIYTCVLILIIYSSKNAVNWSRKTKTLQREVEE